MRATYNSANREAIKARQRAYMGKWYAERASWLASIKTGPCHDCGRADIPSYAYDYDHRPDEIKAFEIGAAINVWGLSKEAILAEIEKCDLVCAVCHRIRTFTRLADRTRLSDGI